MGKIYGIDLGTSNTSIALANETYGGVVQATPVQTIQFNGFKAPMQSTMLPSILYVDENGKEYIGTIGKDLREQVPKRIISNSKRYIGTEAILNAGNKSYTSKDIAALILTTCKKSMERYGFNNDKDKVTITVPASFNADQIKDTIDASKKAGLNNVNIIPEPTAALIDFINNQRMLVKEQKLVDFSNKKRILVFDLGGGTCDVAIIEVLQEEKKIEFKEIAIGRYDELGGVDFDLKIAKYLLKNFCIDRKLNLDNLDEDIKRSMINALRVFAEKAKEFISGSLELGFEDNPSYSQYLMKFYNNEDVSFSINREEYDKATESLYQKAPEALSYRELAKNKNIVDPIINTLREYGIKKTSIDLVFLTGGMTKYVTIKEKITEIMGISEKNVICSPYPLESVSRGASIYQYYDTNLKKINEDKNNMNILESKYEVLDTKIDITKVMASAVMVDVSEGLPITLIEANQKVPCKGKIEGKLKTTSPAGITINLYDGKDENDWQMKLQKSKKAMFKTPIKIGTPIDIFYDIDENKYLTMFINVENEKIKIEQEYE